jgi:hypothetical protein
MDRWRFFGELVLERIWEELAVGLLGPWWVRGLAPADPLWLERDWSKGPPEELGWVVGEGLGKLGCHMGARLPRNNLVQRYCLEGRTGTPGGPHHCTHHWLARGNGRMHNLNSIKQHISL